MTQNLTVNLDGMPTEIKRTKIPLEKIILDIENPRIQYHLDTSLTDNITQGKVAFALAESNDQYDSLKSHIERNGGIYDPIWVVPEGDFFVVIEGNTRSFIYKELSEYYVNEQKWKEIAAYILPHKVERNIINFIRLEKHLFGSTPWGAYEKARELYRLYTEEDYDIKRLQQLSPKLSQSNIKNSIQAYQDMEEQYLKKYQKSPERIKKFSYFVEFRKNRELRKLVKQGKLALLDFCDWVGEGKFNRGEDIRKLSLVLKDEQAYKELIEDDFQAALEQLAQKNPAANSKLFEQIEHVIKGIEKLSFKELSEIKDGYQPAKIVLLKKLHEKVEEILVDIGTIDNGGE
jgi:hypothetical protein